MTSFACMRACVLVLCGCWFSFSGLCVLRAVCVEYVQAKIFLFVEYSKHLSMHRRN